MPTKIAIVFFAFVLVASTTLIYRIQDSGSSAMSQLGVWQLRESKWYDDFIPDFTFLTPTSSVLRISSSFISAGAGYVFVQLNRTELDGKKLQVRWNLYYSYPDDRDLNILEWYVFDQAFDRAEMSSYFTENMTLSPPYWNITCAYVEGLHYPGPQGAPAGWLGWRTDTSEPLNLSSWTSEIVTVLFRNNDAWLGQVTIGDFDWFKILDEDNNEAYVCGFDGTVMMELTGTYHDYGVMMPAGGATNPVTGNEWFNFTTYNKQVNDTFIVDVEVRCVADLMNWRFALEWDPTLLIAVNAVLLPNDPIFRPPESNPPPPDISVPGRLLWGWTFIPDAFSGSIVLASIELRIIAPTGSCFLSLDADSNETFLLNSAGVGIPFTSVDGYYNLVIPPLGDVNRDGRVDMRDIGLCCSAFGSSPEDSKWNPYSDLNGDGTVDMRDIGVACGNFGQHV